MYSNNDEMEQFDNKLNLRKCIHFKVFKSWNQTKNDDENGRKNGDKNWCSSTCTTNLCVQSFTLKH